MHLPIIMFLVYRRLLTELQKVCDHWKSLDDVALLVHHREIKDTLVGIVRRGLSVSAILVLT